MNNTYILSLLLILLCCTPSNSAAQTKGKHVFILSGQSNMAKLKPQDSFIPTLHETLGAEQVLVVKHAKGGRPIRQWVKGWQSFKGEVSEEPTDLYDALMDKVKEALKNQTVKSFTFVWMQGERDAREGHGLVYEKSLKALYEQLCTDLNTQNIHFVIGRLSDFDMENKKYPHWTMIREIQVAFAATDKRFDWIDTDDLNDGLLSNGREKENGLHMTVEGYHKMGKRFAEKALILIRNE